MPFDCINKGSKICCMTWRIISSMPYSGAGGGGGDGTAAMAAMTGAGVVPLHRTLCPTRRNFSTAVAATLRCRSCAGHTVRRCRLTLSNPC